MPDVLGDKVGAGFISKECICSVCVCVCKSVIKSSCVCLCVCVSTNMFICKFTFLGEVKEVCFPSFIILL